MRKVTDNPHYARRFGYIVFTDCTQDDLDALRKIYKEIHEVWFPSEDAPRYLSNPDAFRCFKGTATFTWSESTWEVDAERQDVIEKMLGQLWFSDRTVHQFVKEAIENACLQDSDEQSNQYGTLTYEDRSVTAPLKDLILVFAERS
jgi:hypothetical protein